MAPSTAVVKINRPRVAFVHERKRLFALLEQHRSRPAIWLSGPGGAGKTTLVTSYLNARKLPCLWYQADEGDADLATFFHYLGLAAKKAAPRQRKPLPLLTPEHLPNVSLFIRKYFQELYARLKPPFAIVFDNYQDVPPDSKLHAVLNAALSMVPDGITVFVVSRSEPVPEYARLRANGKMHVVGWEELRFTRDETADVISAKGLRLTNAVVQRVYETTEGWIAGLVLLLEQMKSGNASYEDIAALNKDAIFDYFASMLVTHADRETREFLLKTAFLPEMSPHMAGLMTGNPRAGTTLARLYRDNFFVLRVNHQDAVYQYHQLFREYLQFYAEQSLNPEELSNIRQNAASLLEAADRIEDAVALLHKSGDRDGIARLIREHAPTLHRQGRREVLRAWLSHLPHGMIEGNAHLIYWHGACLASSNPEKSHQELVKAFEMFKTQNDRYWMFTTWADVADSNLVEIEYSVMKKWILVLKEMLKQDPLFPTKAVELRVNTSMFNTLALAAPDDPEISALSNRALELIEHEADLDLNARLITAVHLNVYYVWTGNLSKTGRIAALFQKYAHAPGVFDLTRLAIKSTSCLHAIFAGKHQDCLKSADEGLRLAEQSGIHVRSDQIMCHAAASALSHGDMIKADELLSRLAPRIGSARSFDRAYCHLVTAWKAMIDGDITLAYEQQDMAGGLFKATLHIAAQAVIHFGMADILFHMARIEDAEKELARGFEIGRRMRSTLLEFMGGVIEAHAAFALGQGERGLRALQKTLSLGREQGFTNIMWWRPSLITPLCIRALEAGIEVEYVQGLARKRNLIPETPPLELENWPWPVRIFTLGKFSLMIDGKPLVFTGRTPAKALAMLKMIVAAGAKGVSAEEITDALWPDAEGDVGSASFDTTLHRLRKLITHEEAIRFQNSVLTLDRRYCWVDAWAFERIIEKADSLLVKEKAMELYEGPFLPQDAGEPWTLSTRERLRNAYFEVLIGAARLMTKAGKDEEAVKCLRKGLDCDDLSEELYQQLMLSHNNLGQRAEAVKIYRRCCAMLEREFGLKPSGRTEEIYSAIQRNG